MLREFLQGLVDILYPQKCISCKDKLKAAAADEFICPDCRKKIKINLPPFCSCCGRHLEARNFAKNICAQCLRKPLHFDRAFSPCQYDGVIKVLIHAFKYQGKDYLGKGLSKFMINFIQEYDFPIADLDFIIPIPLHQSRFREREFNQAQILGSWIAQTFQKEFLSNNLVRLHPTKTQTDLEKSLRFLNVQGSFSLKDAGRVKNKNVLLVDDVLTTGATCSEAAATLKHAGSGVVFVLTLAN